MSFPQISSNIFPKRVVCLGPKLFEGCLRIRSQSETSTYLNPDRCGLIDCEIDVRMVEKSERKSDTANAAADNGEFDGWWGRRAS